MGYYDEALTRAVSMRELADAVEGHLVAMFRHIDNVHSGAFDQLAFVVEDNAKAAKDRAAMLVVAASALFAQAHQLDEDIAMRRLGGEPERPRDA